MIDLHTHSAISDGTLKPEDLINYAFAKGITTFAIADHETIIQYKEYKHHADSLGMTLIPACEINVSDLKNFHFVIYGAKNIKFLEKYLNKIRQDNVAICKKVIKKLDKIFGIRLDENEVARFNMDGILDKKAIAKILIKKGYAKDTKEVYDQYIGAKAPAYVPIKKINIRQAIELAHVCGGVIVWAHPFTTRKSNTGQNKKLTTTEFKNLFYKLTELGIDGIEVYTAQTTNEESDILKNWAKEKQLLITGGSDFHSHYLDNKIGIEQLTDQDVELLQKAINRKNAEFDKNETREFLSDLKQDKFKTLTADDYEEIELGGDELC